MIRSKIRYKNHVFGRLILPAVITVLIAIVFLFTLIEYAIGCGQKIYKSDGTFVTGDCAIIDYSPVSGVWLNK